MPTKQTLTSHPKRTVSAASNVSVKHKTVKIKHHHKKSYRKRHYGLLLIALVTALFLFAYLLQYNFVVQSGIKSARNYISGMFQTRDSKSAPALQAVSSTYGYSVKYDALAFYASGVDANTGNLHIGDELATSRPYQKIRISPNWVDKKPNQETLTISYYDQVAIPDATNPDYTNLEKTLIDEPRLKNKLVFKKESTSNVNLAGTQFVRSVWVRHVNTGTIPDITIAYVSYVGIVNGKPLTLEINTGVISKNDTSRVEAIFQPVIDSLRFKSRSQAAINYNPAVLSKAASSLGYLDKVKVNGATAAAAALAPISSAERNNAHSSPAVSKIYNAYCLDISIDGKPYLNNACSAATGSAFFVSSDGYLATNGHVASSSPKDIAILDAVKYLVNGDEQYFAFLAQLAKTNINDPEYVGKSSLEVLEIAIDKMYGIADEHFTVTNSVTNLLVDLNQKQPDIEELLKATEARKEYPGQDSIKRAKVVAVDYRVIDGITAFKASDVALIKIDGSNYPVVKLGAISNIAQGSNLSILGFPANASNNGIVDDKQSKITLTSGKVSAVKNAIGSDKKLIETDTTIGHGNSGGPVLDDNGNVIGIATYTADGSGKGDGVFNYIRDIKDLTDLAAKSSITFDTKSKTQTEWDKGIDLFYKARYSKAVKSFDKVKALYPQHPTVADLTAAAQEKIKSGQDVKDFPVIVVIIGLLVVAGGGGTAVFMILKHKKAHNIYTAQVNAGTLQPLAKGAVAQYATYNSNQHTAMGQPVMQPQQLAPPQQQGQTMPAPVQSPQQHQAVVEAAQPNVITPTTPTSIPVNIDQNQPPTVQ